MENVTLLNSLKDETEQDRAVKKDNWTVSTTMANTQGGNTIEANYWRVASGKFTVYLPLLASYNVVHYVPYSDDRLHDKYEAGEFDSEGPSELSDLIRLGSSSITLPKKMT